MTRKLNRISARITQPKSQGGSQAMLYGTGFSREDMDKAQVGISSVWYDANIALPGCDKNMPGCIMAMGRVNRPALMIYGGTIKPGHLGRETIDIISAFQSYGQFLAGTITEEQRQQMVASACPGAGACGGMYTANTMAAAIEALGMSLPYLWQMPPYKSTHGTLYKYTKNVKNAGEGCVTDE